MKISKSDLGKALTAKIPQNGKWIDNPYKNWNEINPSLPNLPIRVYGPPTTSGTRASFAEMVNQKGYCGKDKEAKEASKARGDKKGKKCRAMRTDGAFIEAGEQDNLIVQKLNEDPNAYGIFGFSYLDQNSDTLQGAEIVRLLQHLKILRVIIIQFQEHFIFMLSINILVLYLA